MTAKASLSDLDQQIVAVVTAWELTYGVSPTYRDLAEACDCSLDTIHRMVRRLLREGRLRWDPGHLRLPHVP